MAGSSGGGRRPGPAFYIVAVVLGIVVARLAWLAIDLAR